MSRFDYIERKGPRRGAATMSATLEDSALLVVATNPRAWERVRLLPMNGSPKSHAMRCLWLLAAAWRVVMWLDYEGLTAKQLKAICSLVTDGKTAAKSLPSGFRIDAEEILRSDEEERRKEPGPEMVEAPEREPLHVERAYDPKKVH